MEKKSGNSSLFVHSLLFVFLIFEIAFIAIFYKNVVVETKTAQEIIQDLEEKIKKTQIEAQQFTSFEDIPSKPSYIVEKLKKNNTDFVRALQLLGEAVPEKAWMSYLSQTGTQLRIDGYALTAQAITGFISALKNTQQFGDIRLMRAEATSAQAIKKFSILCQIGTR